MKQLLTLLLFFGLHSFAYAQTNTDSLIARLASAKADTNKVNLLNIVSKAFVTNNPDEAIAYAKQAAVLAAKLHWEKGLGNAYNALGNGLSYTSNFKEALDNYSAAFKILDSTGDKPDAANALSNIGMIYTYTGDFGQALKYNLKALELRESIGDKKGVASSYNNIAGLYEYEGNLVQALAYYEKSLRGFSMINNLQGIAANYHNIGSIYRAQGNFPEALNNFLSALKIDEQMRDTTNIATDYSSIGILYQSHKDYNEALQNHFRAVQFFERLHNEYNVAAQYSNIGATYYDWDSLGPALQHFYKALKMGKDMRDSIVVANAYTNIGEVYYDMHNLNAALNNYDSALYIYQTKVNDTGSLAALFGNLAKLYVTKRNFATAENYALKSLTLAEKSGALIWIKNAHETLAGVYEQTGKSKDALQHYKAFAKAEDSLFNQDNTKKLVQAQMQYDFDKKQLVAKAEYTRQLAIAEEKRRSNIITISLIAAAIIIITFLSFYFYRRVEKASHRAQIAELRQEALLAQLDTHFISDTIVSINHLIKSSDSNSASGHLLNFGGLIRDTLETSFKKTVSITEEIEFINNYLSLALLQYPKNHITISIAVAENIDTDNTFMPPMVLQVLVENAVHHAFNRDKGGMITIRVNKSNNIVYCIVEDNGMGRVAAAKTAGRHSYGNSLAEKLLQTWSETFGKATYDITDLVDQDNQLSGTKAEFSFPFVEK